MVCTVSQYHVTPSVNVQTRQWGSLLHTAEDASSKQESSKGTEPMGAMKRTRGMYTHYRDKTYEKGIVHNPTGKQLAAFESGLSQLSS